MSQWEQLMHLDSASREKLHELYCQNYFPMDARMGLAQWIEGQAWEKASFNPQMASVLFHGLLEKLDEQHGRLIQQGALLDLSKNRSLKQHFQKHGDNPVILAKIIEWLLNREREILRAAQVTEEIQDLQVQPNPGEMDSQTIMDLKIDELSHKLQELSCTIRSIEFQQDDFHIKYITSKSEASSDDGDKKMQDLLNALHLSRKSLLFKMKALIDMAEDVFNVLVMDKLTAWKRQQQRACIGAPEHNSLEQLDKWFTVEVKCLFELREFLRKLDELAEKVKYNPDPFKMENPELQMRVNNLLMMLIKSAFVVESQPAMQQGRGPLMLRTTVKFSVSVRLLFQVPQLNHAMNVTVFLDRDAKSVKGYRRFDLLGTTKKALKMSDGENGGMVADFRHLTLRERKSAGGSKGLKDSSLTVTEELHLLSFETVFRLHGLSVTLATSALPVVIFSGANQCQSARASVLWYSMLSTEPHNWDTRFFSSPPLATWPQLSEMLHWQFLSITSRGLNPDQLGMIAQKLFGKLQSYESCQVSWSRFLKENIPETNFSFWVWYDGILVLVKMYLENLWNDGYIMGFVSKDQAKTLLEEKEPGTFLVRFSESCKDGAITFFWLEKYSDGSTTVDSVVPFTKSDLIKMPFSEVIRTYQVVEGKNLKKPLRFLYPNIPKDEAFGKYYMLQNQAVKPYHKKVQFVATSEECFNKSEVNHTDMTPATHQNETDMIPATHQNETDIDQAEGLEMNLSEIMNNDPMILDATFASLSNEMYAPQELFNMDTLQELDNIVPIDMEHDLLSVF